MDVKQLYLLFVYLSVCLFVCKINIPIGAESWKWGLVGIGELAVCPGLSVFLRTPPCLGLKSAHSYVLSSFPTQSPLISKALSYYSLLSLFHSLSPPPLFLGSANSSCFLQAFSISYKCFSPLNQLLSSALMLWRLVPAFSGLALLEVGRWALSAIGVRDKARYGGKARVFLWHGLGLSYSNYNWKTELIFWRLIL